MITKKEVIVLKLTLYKERDFFDVKGWWKPQKKKKTLKLAKVALSWIASAQRVILTFKSKYGGQFNW